MLKIKYTMNNFMMELSQLQAIIQECKQTINKMEQNKAQDAIRKTEAYDLKKKIKETRIELIKLKYQLKNNVTANKQIQDIVRANQQLQRSVNNLSSINSKQLGSYDKIMKMASHIQEKVNGLDEKIKRAQSEISQSQAKSGHLEHKFHYQTIYQGLEKQFQVRTKEFKAQNQFYSHKCRETEQNLQNISSIVKQIDEQYDQIYQKVEIQKQIIRNIKQSQLGRMPSFQIRVKSKTQPDQPESGKLNVLKNTQTQTFLQQTTVQNILMRQQSKKEQQSSIMGHIFNQNMKKNPYIGRIVNNRKRSNFSQLRKISQSQSKTQSFVSNFDLGILNSSERLKNLQVNKRVRTRQTDMRKYSHQFRNVVLNQLQQKSKFESNHQQSVFDIYMQMKQKSNNRIGRVEILKIAKHSNRRSFINGHNGTGL